MNHFFSKILIAFFTFCHVAGLMSCKKQFRNEFKIHATVDSLPVSTIYLEAIGIDAITLVDSTLSDKQGYFSLNGILYEPSIYRIRLGDNKFIYLFVDNKEIELKANYSQPFNYAVSGSAGSQQLSNFLKQYYILNKDVIPLQLIYDSLYFTGNTDSLKTIVTTDLDKKKNSLNQFIKANADTSSYFQLATFYANFLNINQEQPYLKLFNSKLKERFPTEKTLTHYINKFESIHIQDTSSTVANKVNQYALPFEIADKNGQLIQLNKYKNKIVLLYFWAPWNAKSITDIGAVNNLQDTNIVSIGVSIDEDKDNWITTINKHNILGIQVSTHAGWNCSIAKKYNVISVPHYFTIDHKGMIIYDGSLTADAKNMAKQAVAKIPKPSPTDSLLHP